MVALSVCAWPFRVSPGRFGTSGAVENASAPAVTANCVVSLTASAGALATSERPQQAAKTVMSRRRMRPDREIMWTFLRDLAPATSLKPTCTAVIGLFAEAHKRFWTNVQNRALALKV